MLQGTERTLHALSTAWQYVDFPGPGGPSEPSELASLEGLLWTRVSLPAGTSFPSGPRTRWFTKSFELPGTAQSSTSELMFTAPSTDYSVWLDGAPLSVLKRAEIGGTVRASFGLGELGPGRHEVFVRVSSEGPRPGTRFGLDGVWRLHLRPELHLEEGDFDSVGWCSNDRDADVPPCRLEAAVVNGSPVPRTVRVHFVCRALDGRVLADVISPAAELPAGGRAVLGADPSWERGADALRKPGGVALSVDVELVEYAQIVDRRSVPFWPDLLGFEPGAGRFQIGGTLRVLRGAVLDTTGSLGEDSDRALRRDLTRLGQLGLDLVVLRGRRPVALQSVQGGSPLVVVEFGGEMVAGNFVERTGFGPSLAAALGRADSGAPDSAADGVATLGLSAASDRRDGARAMLGAARELESGLLALTAAARGSDAPGSDEEGSAEPGPALLLHTAAVSSAERGGLLDVWRTPGFAAQLLRSQRSVEEDPLCYPAVVWDSSLSGPIEVYSNAEEVRLFVNGVQRGVLLSSTPGARSSAPTAALPHPPYRFEGQLYERGELRVVGYADGRPIAERAIRTPGEPARVVVLGETLDLPLMANGTDAIYVHAIVLDETGAVCTDFTGEVSFSTGGEVTLVGPARVRARAGLASAAVRAGMEPGDGKVAADLGRISSPTLIVAVVPAEPGEL